MQKVNFKETQRYQNKIVLIVLGIACAIAIIAGIALLLAPQPQIENAFFFFVLAIAIRALMWWLMKLKLSIAITNKCIKFKFFPLHAKKHTIAWDDVENCEIIKAPEAAQWSGLNISYSHERRYTLNGRNGLAIKTKNGENFFIGCRDIMGLTQALNEMQISK